MGKRLMILETPYAGDTERNLRYARACLRDCLLRDEAPIASHLLYTQPGVLRDEIPEERQQGIDAGLAWGRVADATVVYDDLGISRGMAYGIAAARDAGRTVEFRQIEMPSSDENSDVWRVKRVHSGIETELVEELANCICEALASWHPEPFHQMAYEDVARAVLTKFLAKKLPTPLR